MFGSFHEDGCLGHLTAVVEMEKNGAETAPCGEPGLDRLIAIRWCSNNGQVISELYIYQHLNIVIL